MEIYEAFFIVSVLIVKEEISLFWKINKRHVKLIEGVYVPRLDQPVSSQGDNRDNRFVMGKGDKT